MSFFRILAPAVLLAAASPALAAGPSFDITIRDHKFEPSTIEVPAGERVRLNVTNADATPEEFESNELHVEKVIPGKSKGVVFVGPLEIGDYPFMGEFHANTARGVLVVR